MKRKLRETIGAAFGLPSGVGRPHLASFIFGWYVAWGHLAPPYPASYPLPCLYVHSKSLVFLDQT